MALKAHRTQQQRKMARLYRQYGPSFISPEWANCDGFDEEVERQTELKLNDTSEYAELLGEAVEDEDFCLALKKLYDSIEYGLPDTKVGEAAKTLYHKWADVAYNVTAKEVEYEQSRRPSEL